jgi:two-component system chemotaxis response regulator CheB
VAKRLVVIGTSSGGIDTLIELTRALPPDFAAPIAVVMHTAPESPGVLPDILSRNGTLAAVHPANGERLRPGRIYVAPPDHHLLIEPGRVQLSKGPRENRFRPAIDPLFRSAAQAYGPAAIGVILSGSLDDGVAGLWTIKQLGGTAVVQDPAQALFPSMPENAMARVAVDYVVAMSDMPGLLADLALAEPAAAHDVDIPTSLDIELRIVKEEDPMKAGVEHLGAPSRLTCPECHGVLSEWDESGHTRFRCHTGHAYSIASLRADIDQSIEATMWNAIRSLQEGAILLRQIANRADVAEAPEGAVKLNDRAGALERHANLLRELATVSVATTQASRR